MPDQDGIKIRIDTPGAAEATTQIHRLLDEIDKLGDEADATAQAVRELGADAPAAAGGTRNMGFAALEASRAFEDLQYGIRGVLNNIPGLVMSLGGTAGIAGAASFAAVAAAALIPKLQGIFGESKEAAKAAEDLAEKLAELRAARDAAAANRGAESAQAFIASLDDEEAAITAQNEALDRNLQLLSARRRAQVEAVSAQAALDLAKIDASDMSEEDKIRARAKVQGRVDRASAQARLDSLNDRVTGADLAADRARDAAGRGSADLGTAREELAAAEAEREQLRRRQARANMSAASAEGIRKQQADLDREETAFLASLMGESMSAKDSKRFEDRRKQLDASLAQAEREALAFTGGDRARLAELEGTADRQGSIAALQSGIETLAEAAEKLAAAADKAEAAAASTRDIATVEAGTVIDTYDKRRQASAITTGAAATKAADRAAAERAAADLAAKEAALRAGTGAAGTAFGGAAQAIAERGFSATGKALSGVASGLGNGADSGELATLRTEFEKAVEGSKSATVGALRDMLANLQSQAREIETLRAQIKNTTRRP